MRKLYLFLFLFLPLATWAQGEWEVPDATPSTPVKTKAKKEQKARQAEDYKWAKYLGDIKTYQARHERVFFYFIL